MPPLKLAFRTGQIELPIGAVPRVVGVISSFDIPWPEKRPENSCDVVEVRLDKISPLPKDWLERCIAIQDRGWPVLLTIRLKNEGGEWTGGDEERLPDFQDAIELLAAVDIEWRSRIVHRVAMHCKRHKKVCVISYHDFKKTPKPAVLAEVIREAQRMASIVKIATQLHSADDEDTLQLLLKQKWKRPLCLIGMGPEWTHTRVSLAKLGSCLTYGYLDKSTAPGQTSAAELVRQLHDGAGKSEVK